MLVVLGVQLDNLAQQVAEQMVVILFFLPLLLLAVAVAVLVVALKLEKQVVLVVAEVTVVTLAGLEIRHPHHQVRATMAEHPMPPTMAVVAVAVRLP